MNDFLDQDVMYLLGVGPKKVQVLNKEAKIYTLADLLYFFPYKYIDKSKFYSVAELQPDMSQVQIVGIIKSIQEIGEGRRKRLSAIFTDGTGTIELVWFKGAKWIKSNLITNKRIIVFGKPTLFNGSFNMAHPEIEPFDEEKAKKVNTFEGAYLTTEKMKNSFITSKTINTLQKNLFREVFAKIQETLPEQIIKKYKLLSLKQALLNIHFPKSQQFLQLAEFRLKFEELFIIQLALLRKNRLNKKTIASHKLEHVGDYFNQFYHKCLPFELTNAQKRVFKEIRYDCNTGMQMNRLLQGDVGSGKTMIALMSMLLSVDNNLQAAIMAPTEILATQHYASICEMTEGLDINIGLLTGSTRAKQRRILHEQLTSGEMHILIGTHALIEDTVQFKNLGMVIIDEQHRFGVIQRARLWKKNRITPHVLVMTATPIPRTLAMTLYGDLDVSTIDELPPGRKPIKTIHFTDAQRLRVFGFMREEIEKGRQVYVVYPLIKESEKLDFKDLEDGYESITRAFPLPQYQVSIVHGKMKPKDKDYEMQRFVKGETHIMVATTVIEVGVNVPNASVMIIESAERFGLSQLHQLRGRVGRGAEQSFCVLMTSNKLSNESRLRMETMVRTNDGFDISEVDLKLRGPGDLDGTAQSGVGFDLKIANLGKDSQILQLARECATEIIDDDPMLQKEENRILFQKMAKNERKKINLSQIS